MNGRSKNYSKIDKRSGTSALEYIAIQISIGLKTKMTLNVNSVIRSIEN